MAVVQNGIQNAWVVIAAALWLSRGKEAKEWRMRAC